MFDVPKSALLFLCALGASPTAAQNPPCDLKSVVNPSGYKDSFPFGSDKIDSETRITLIFDKDVGGDMVISRVADTFLFKFDEKIVGQIDAMGQDLPHGDCGPHAVIGSRSAQITPPTYTIAAHVDASVNLCFPTPPTPQVPYVCGVNLVGFPQHPVPKICYQPGPTPPTPPPVRIGNGTIDSKFNLSSAIVGKEIRISVDKSVQSHLDNQTAFF
jgi:hypothetical protein